MTRTQLLQHSLVALFVVAWLIQPSALAGAATPGEVQYQGLLLDDLGDPVNGLVDFSFELFDAATGGTSLWTESHVDVDVVDGVYDVALGSITPLGSSVLDGGSVYLEISVEAETLTPRQRLLAVPYAIRAGDADSVGGVSGIFIDQIFRLVDWDGGDPPSDDPSEGLDDVDGDGLANFIDADNDGDGQSDVDELAQGTDINLETPTITGFYPTVADGQVTTSIRVDGTFFEPGITVSFGTQNPVPSSVTSTSFDVDVGPQSQGVVNVVVTRTNGESSTVPYTMRVMQPTIQSLDPSALAFDQTSLIAIDGNDFTPAMTVSFGSENPVPQNVTLTSAEVTVGPQSVGEVNVTVTHPNGNDATTQFRFFMGDGLRRVFVTSGTYDGNLGGIAGADAICNSEASAAGQGTGYRAWLSDGVSDPATVFGKTHGPYRLVDSTFVVFDWNDLVDGNLSAAIDVDADGSSASGGVWSNVKAVGSTNLSADDCGNWSTTAGVGRFGNAGSINLPWSQGFISNCDVPLRLYCFED